MGWLSALRQYFFEAGVYREIALPPVRIVPLGPLQLVDLRAVDDPFEAVTVGAEVGVEMVRTLPSPEQRGFLFAPLAVQLLLDDPARFRKLAPLLREKVDGLVAFLVEPAVLERAGPICRALELVPTLCRGPDTIDIEERIGAPDPRRHEVAHPKDMPNMYDVSGIPGVAFMWQDELVIDLRRIGRGPTAFNTAWLGAKFATKFAPVPNRRIWIVPSWAHVDGDTRDFAREALAQKLPAHGDHVAFDGEPATELRRFTEELGLTVTVEPRYVTEGLSLPYAQLAQNVLLAYALGKPYASRL